MSDLYWLTDGQMGVFAKHCSNQPSHLSQPQTVMIDATYLKVHRTASRLRVKKGIFGG